MAPTEIGFLNISMNREFTSELRLRNFERIIPWNGNFVPNRESIALKRNPRAAEISILAG